MATHGGFQRDNTAVGQKIRWTVSVRSSLPRVGTRKRIEAVRNRYNISHECSFCHHRGDIINKCAGLGHLLVAVALALDLGNITITFHHLLQSGFFRLEVVGNTSDDLLLLLTLGLELIVLVH